MYIHNHFHSSFIVFDGYSNDPSIKDETSQRKTGSDIGLEVNITLNMMLMMEKTFSDKP